MLPSSEHVRQAYLGPQGILSVPAGQLHPHLLVDCSTIDPITSREVAAAAADTPLHPHAAEAHGGQASPMMIDAPVSGGVPGAQAGSLTFMVGGWAGGRVGKRYPCWHCCRSVLGALMSARLPPAACACSAVVRRGRWTRLDRCWRQWASESFTVSKPTLLLFLRSILCVCRPVYNNNNVCWWLQHLPRPLPGRWPADQGWRTMRNAVLCACPQAAPTAMARAPSCATTWCLPSAWQRCRRGWHWASAWAWCAAAPRLPRSAAAGAACTAAVVCCPSANA